MTGPLNGVRVIEIGTLIAAPFAARLMGEFGAEVIKIESMGQGDPLRKWRKLHEGTSLWWYLQSRNKKSLSLNLKSPEGIEIVKRLAESADVLIENLRPGALEKLGLGWDVLHALNPKLTLVATASPGLIAIVPVSAPSARPWAASATPPALPVRLRPEWASASVIRWHRCTPSWAH
jgi:crotonobetainyl-CoA:carnitine CoA-transferase CaiB-like acyl-CoA transferase